MGRYTIAGESDFQHWKSSELGRLRKAPGLIGPMGQPGPAKPRPDPYPDWDFVAEDIAGNPGFYGSADYHMPPGYATPGGAPTPGYATPGSMPTPGYATPGSTPTPGYATPGSTPTPDYASMDQELQVPAGLGMASQAAARHPNIEPGFFSSPEYQEIPNYGQQNAIQTKYFGQLDGYRAGQDAAYEAYLNRTGQPAPTDVSQGWKDEQAFLAATEEKYGPGPYTLPPMAPPAPSAPSAFQPAPPAPSPGTNLNIPTILGSGSGGGVIPALDSLKSLAMRGNTDLSSALYGSGGGGRVSLMRDGGSVGFRPVRRMAGPSRNPQAGFVDKPLYNDARII